MGGWWNWTKWALYYVVTIVLLLTIYGQVIQARFECVVFSVLALIYLELIAQYSAWGVELLGERDHRNEIHRLLSEHLGVPLAPEVNKGIDELSGQTAKAGTRHQINAVARSLLCVLVLWNLFKAAFGW